MPRPPLPSKPTSGAPAPGEPGPLPDVVGPGIRLLLVGINPGLRSASVGCHFAGPGNRFWPALYAAGITPQLFVPAQQHRLPDLGVGITNLARRPSARASDVTAAELRDGSRQVVELAAHLRVRVVAVLGVSAFRVAFERPGAAVGPQGDLPAGSRWWVLHNPSGLNAHATPADHAAGLRAEAAVFTDLLGL
ncbi:MAG: mismatch-specific DNA-glycosylase [Actinomycetota bacterium]|nr:mismatch-specific DNA-glycosylase [Actinomycetota bacterium]